MLLAIYLILIKRYGVIMKKLYKFILPILFLALLGTIIYSINFSRNIDNNILGEGNGLVTTQKLPLYHFFAILQNSDEPYQKDLVRGLTESAKANNIALEINYTNSPNDYNDTIRLLNTAIISNVDGIITQGYNTPEFDALIHETESENIPLVSLAASVPQSTKAAYVGTNGFELGYTEGKLVAKATKGKAKVAMVLEGIDSSYGNVKIEGFKDATKSNKGIEIATIKVSEPGVLGALNITQEILTKFPEVNAIVCTSAKDTIGVAQLVVDFNRVGDIAIIGFDSSPDILKYIQKGIVYGTIVPNAYLTGTKSMKFLLDVQKNGRASSYISTDSTVITSTNVNEYIKK